MQVHDVEVTKIIELKLQPDVLRHVLVEYMTFKTFRFLFSTQSRGISTYY